MTIVWVTTVKLAGYLKEQSFFRVTLESVNEFLSFGGEIWKSFVYWFQVISSSQQPTF